MRRLAEKAKLPPDLRFCSPCPGVLIWLHSSLWVGHLRCPQKSRLCGERQWDVSLPGGKAGTALSTQLLRMRESQGRKRGSFHRQMLKKHLLNYDESTCPQENTTLRRWRRGWLRIQQLCDLRLATLPSSRTHCRMEVRLVLAHVP